MARDVKEKFILFIIHNLFHNDKKVMHSGDNASLLTLFNNNEYKTVSPYNAYKERN
jgi:hypothetical protein